MPWLHAPQCARLVLFREFPVVGFSCMQHLHYQSHLFSRSPIISIYPFVKRACHLMVLVANRTSMMVMLVNDRSGHRFPAPSSTHFSYGAAPASDKPHASPKASHIQNSQRLQRNCSKLRDLDLWPSINFYGPKAEKTSKKFSWTRIAAHAPHSQDDCLKQRRER